MRKPKEWNQWLRSFRRVVVVTGAGVSVGSGIPDFSSRAEGGLSVEEQQALTVQSLHYRKYRFWQVYRKWMEGMEKATPSFIHHWLAELEQRVLSLRIITQNVDGLHQAAGSTQVLEVGGHNRMWKCSRCEQLEFPRARDDSRKERCQHELQEEGPCNTFVEWQEGQMIQICPTCDTIHSRPRSAHQKQVGRCATLTTKRRKCRGSLRPLIVLQDEPLWHTETAKNWIREADVLLVIGTSLQRKEIRDWITLALRRSIPVCLLNKTPTPLDLVVDEVIHAPAEMWLTPFHDVELDL